MSLLHAIDEAINKCKAEESRLTESIRQSKDLLNSMRTRVTDARVLEPAGSVSSIDDILPEEQQEIELLDKVLKKALKIRSASEGHKEIFSDGDLKSLPNDNRDKSAFDHKQDDKRQKQVKSASSESRNSSQRSTGNNVGRPVLIRKGTTTRTLVTGKKPVQKSSSVKINSTGTQKKICDESTNHEEPSKDQSTKISSQRICEDTSDKRHTTSLPNEQWIPSPLLPVWRSQRAKQIKLWNKVQAHQSRSVPERDHFTERLRSTFPSDFPSGCPVDIKTNLDVLARRCLDLTHCFLTDQSRPSGSQPGLSDEGQYESSLMLQGLEKMTEKLLRDADLQIKDWEMWDKCHPETMCPVRRRGEWGDSNCPGLPFVISYTSETELRQLENQMLRVEQLRQTVCLQQAMSDHFASYRSKIESGTERPSAVALRGLYSLLAEGGLQFPSLVLDSE